MPQEYLPMQNEMDDKRKKISTKDHEQIKRDYQELKSYQKTADKWNVSKRLIIFIVNPHIREAYQKHRYDKKVWLIYYNKEKHTEAMRRHRLHKNALKLNIKPNRTRLSEFNGDQLYMYMYFTNQLYERKPTSKTPRIR